MRVRLAAVGLACLVVFAPAAVLAQSQLTSGGSTAVVTQSQPPSYASEREYYDYIAIYYGGDFGGQLFPGKGIMDIGKGTPNAVGVAVGFWGNGMLSGELDFCYHPGFGLTADQVLYDGDLYTLTGNFVINPTIRAGSQMIRPYFLIGGGLMRARVKDFPKIWKDTANRGIVDVGGGIQYYFHPRIGVRGDIRYNVGIGGKNDEDGWGEIDGWNFFRGTIGIAFTF